MRFSIALSTIASLILLAGTAHSDLIWFDGTREPGEKPPGKLLSDNLGYYGDCIFTGVRYQYEVVPDLPADRRSDHSQELNCRLLDGRIGAKVVDTGGGLAGKGL